MDGTGRGTHTDWRRGWAGAAPWGKGEAGRSAVGGVGEGIEVEREFSGNGVAFPRGVI